MSVEDIVRMAVIAAYLEGAHWGYTVKRGELTMDEVTAACDAYAARALPNIMAALAEEEGDT